MASQQRYVSRELTHFAGADQPTAEDKDSRYNGLFLTGEWRSCSDTAYSRCDYLYCFVSGTSGVISMCPGTLFSDVTTLNNSTVRQKEMLIQMVLTHYTSVSATVAYLF